MTFVPSYVMSHQSIARFLNKLLNLSLLSSMSYQSRLIMYNLFNKFLSDITPTYIHVCNSDNPINWLKQPEDFLQ